MHKQPVREGYPDVRQMVRNESISLARKIAAPLHEGCAHSGTGKSLLIGFYEPIDCNTSSIPNETSICFLNKSSLSIYR